jgi:hypothetical protein
VADGEHGHADKMREFLRYPPLWEFDSSADRYRKQVAVIAPASVPHNNRMDGDAIKRTLHAIRYTKSSISVFVPKSIYFFKVSSANRKRS